MSGWDHGKLIKSYIYIYIHIYIYIYIYISQFEKILKTHILYFAFFAEALSVSESEIFYKIYIYIYTHVYSNFKYIYVQIY